MRHFIVLGHEATTEPRFPVDNLRNATGRLDVLVRCVGAALTISHDIRRDVELYLTLLGPPRAPVTLRLHGPDLRYLNPDERSTALLLRRALALGYEGESSPGLWRHGWGLGDVLERLTCPVILLDEAGKDIRGLDLPGEVAFVVSDHRDPTPDERTLLLDRGARPVSLGPVSLHADQCITLVHNELDRRGA